MNIPALVICVYISIWTKAFRAFRLSLIVAPNVCSYLSFARHCLTLIQGDTIILYPTLKEWQFQVPNICMRIVSVLNFVIIIEVP